MESVFYQEVEIPIGTLVLNGELVIPKHAQAIIVFSHGSGSSRFSSRNRLVAKYLQERYLVPKAKLQYIQS